MQHSRTRIIFDGAVAGLLGAAAVAAWFLILDAARGRVLDTPALLAATLMHGGNVAGVAKFQLVAEYTILHVFAFVSFGVIGALLLETAEREPALMVSLAVFLAAFEMFFLGVVMFLGPAVMRELTWWGIVVANVLATGVMLRYFLFRHRSLAYNLFEKWLEVAREGLLAGLIGAFIVAVWFMAYDLAAGEFLRTPLLLGEAIFNGAMPATPGTTVPLIIGYTVIHFMAFTVFGVALAILMAATDREPLVALGVLVVFAIFEVFFLGWVTLLDSSLLEELGWWKIIAANAFALTGMIIYEMRNHRGLVLRLEERWAALEGEGEETSTPTPRSHL